AGPKPPQPGQPVEGHGPAQGGGGRLRTISKTGPVTRCHWAVSVVFLEKTRVFPAAAPRFRRLGEHSCRWPPWFFSGKEGGCARNGKKCYLALSESPCFPGFPHRTPIFEIVPYRQRTPAMAAGLTDHVWTIREWATYPAAKRLRDGQCRL